MIRKSIPVNTCVYHIMDNEFIDEVLHLIYIEQITFV